MMIGEQYKIVSELGSGGMGVVYRAVDVLLETEVAIKKLRGDFSQTPEVAQRFLREAKIQAKLNHPNITRVNTCLRDGDVFYIVMEFVAGTPLSKLIPIPYARLLPLAIQMLDGLDYAHGMGVLHRDIKPDNIMVTSGGEVKIMDFGIAHVLGSTRHTREKVIMGTLEYISPERITGKDPERSSDIYSLGAVLFEALTGKLPFEGQSEYELLRQHLEAPPPSVRSFVAECPEAIDAVIQKALAKEPANRFANCGSMKEALIAELTKLPPAVVSAGIAAHDIAGKRAVLPDFDLHRQIGEMLQRIATLQKNADHDGALKLAREAVEVYPQVRAFQIAALCCSRD
jgi:serine/threonine protein kinase